MGRKDDKYKKTLEQQARAKLKEMVHFGESKKEHIQNSKDRRENEKDDSDPKIFSISTYKNYCANLKHFFKYMEEYHPEITKLDDARIFVEEYLEKAEYDGKSAWTIHLYGKALGKLFCITENSDDYISPPPRKREDIKRSRGPAKRDKHFSEITNIKLVRFCKGTGLRRSELGSVRKEDLHTKDQIENQLSTLKSSTSINVADAAMINALTDTRLFHQQYFIYVKGKGGRIRFAPVLEKYQDTVLEKFDEAKPGSKVWTKIHSNADIHAYRSDYANSVYLMYARPIEDIKRRIEDPTGKKKYKFGIYFTRNDEAGGEYDRNAMFICSKALGHNRVTVVAENYLRGI